MNVPTNLSFNEALEVYEKVKVHEDPKKDLTESYGEFCKIIATNQRPSEELVRRISCNPEYIKDPSEYDSIRRDLERLAKEEA